MENNGIKVLAKELEKRNNPTDMKTSIIGKVVQLNPVIVAINEGLILLKEGDQLEISEWFRFRCNINKTDSLSSSVPDKLSSSNDDCSSAENVSEIHSYTGSDCNMPDAIKSLSSAIQSTNEALLLVNGELLALKCILEVGDFVAVASLEEYGKYVLLDKVL